MSSHPKQDAPVDGTGEPDSASHSEDEDGDGADSVCTKQHCFYCCDALASFFSDAEPLPPAFANGKYPLFVTWNIRSSRPGGHARLRGCIGNFEPQDLHEGLKEYALIAARQDTRFSPVSEKELPRLECQVSLLTDFEDARTYLDWTPGTHGIYLTFPHPSSLPPASSSLDPSPLTSSTSTPVAPGDEAARARWWSRGTAPRPRMLSATYLPEVAPEQGWTKVQAVDSAIRKAGWEGRITEDVRRSIKLRRYQSRKCGVGWDEYVRWREAQTALQKR